jgi:hypothetical protein
LSGFGQAYGGIREEQREQGIEDKVRAATFAAPSAALDAFGVGRFIPGSSASSATLLKLAYAASPKPALASARKKV